MEAEFSITSAFSLVFPVETLVLLSFGFGNLSRMMFGAKGYIPALRNPDTILLMVIPLDQARANSEENWNFAITRPGLSNKY